MDQIFWKIYRKLWVLVFHINAERDHRLQDESLFKGLLRRFTESTYSCRFWERGLPLGWDGYDRG
jgi:hypothetical protein